MPKQARRPRVIKISAEEMEKAFRRVGEEDRAKFAKLLKEAKTTTDPQRLVNLGNARFVDNFYGPHDEENHSIRLAVAKNEATPTAYLFYLLGYVNQHVPNPLGLMPGPRQPAPFVDEDIRNATGAQLIKRDWKLTPFEEEHLSAPEKDALKEKLDRARGVHNTTHLRTTKSPLGSVVGEILRSRN